MTNNIERNDWEAQSQNTPIVISPETRQSPEWKEIQGEAQKKLEALKEEIKQKGMSFDLTKRVLDNLDKVTPENKPFLLWGIFSWLNQVWISIEWLNEAKKITLTPPKMPIKSEGNLASQEETLRYNELINHYIASGKIGISDINKGLLYRTTSIDDYVSEKADKNFSTPEYVQRLLKKYHIYVEGDIKNISFWNGPEGKNQFEKFKKDIRFAITNNQADKEFLLAYFDDVYYRGGKSLSADEITPYTQQSVKNQKEVLTQISHLDEEQKFALWIRDSSDAKQISRDVSKDPIGFLKKNMTRDNIALAMIFWLIWAFFGGKKWFGIWALLWFWVWAGWLSFASEQLSKLGEKEDKKNTPSQIKPSWTNNSKETQNPHYGKINFSQETDPTKKWELQKLWWDLSKNNTFLWASTSILSIFENNTQKTFEEMRDELKKYWIELTNENKDYHKTIFEEILKQRKALIWDTKKDETIKDYLNRTRKIEAGAITWSTKEDETKMQEKSPSKEDGKKTPEAENTISELENLQRDGFSELYILSRGIELGYTFTKTPPSWMKPSWSMWILGSTWYVIKTPLTIQAYKYMMSAGWYFMTGGLHKSLESWNLAKVVWWTGDKINWIGNKASELLQLEMRKEKANLEKYLQWIDTKVSNHVLEWEKIKNRLKSLDTLEAAMKWWDNATIQKALQEYRNQFDPDFKWHMVGWKDIKLEAEIKKFQEIQTRIEKIEADTKTQIETLETQAKQAKTAKEISDLQTKAQDIAKKSNIEIERLNTDAALSLSKLDENTIKSIAQESKFVDSLIKANDWAKNFLSKFNGTWWKAFIWIGMISLLYNGRGWLASIVENWFSEENKNDAIDLWIWFIPVIGWIHDLKIAYEGKDLNNRTLSSGERWIRTAFGIIGLIPWAGTLLKWALKWTSVAVKWADVAIQTTHIVWKWLTYSLLWYSIATASKEIYINNAK